MVSSKADVRGRYAPSPTGLLHVGNARTALAAWLSVRARQGAFVVRIEDLDLPRVVPGMAEAALRDLAWLGLDWDEGPDRDGPHGPYRQSERTADYEDALVNLFRAGRLFPCTRSRKDLRNVASAPHGEEDSPPYPPAFRPRQLDPDWFERMKGEASPGAAIRFRVDPQAVSFCDAVFGEVTERVDLTCGDFVLKRRDGLYAYQLAVVVDDLAMSITEVVRGADLLGSTARQILLTEALGGARPEYAHVPLVLNADAEKLSKRDRGLTIDYLRDQGVRPEQLVGYFAYSLGMLPEPVSLSARDVVPLFSRDRISPAPWRLPSDLAGLLLRL